MASELELIVAGLADDAAVHWRQFNSRQIFRLGDFQTKLLAIRHGLGYGWLPQYMAGPLLRSGQLSSVRYDNGQSDRLAPYFAWRLSRPLGRAGTIVRSFLENQDWSEEN